MEFHLSSYSEPLGFQYAPFGIQRRLATDPDEIVRDALVARITYAPETVQVSFSNGADMELPRTAAAERMAIIIRRFQGAPVLIISYAAAYVPCDWSHIIQFLQGVKVIVFCGRPSPSDVWPFLWLDVVPSFKFLQISMPHFGIYDLFRNAIVARPSPMVSMSRYLT